MCVCVGLKKGGKFWIIDMYQKSSSSSLSNAFLRRSNLTVDFFVEPANLSNNPINSSSLKRPKKYNIDVCVHFFREINIQKFKKEYQPASCPVWAIWMIAASTCWPFSGLAMVMVFTEKKSFLCINMVLYVVGRIQNNYFLLGKSDLLVNCIGSYSITHNYNFCYAGQ